MQNSKIPNYADLQERWVPIRGYEGLYDVSDMGRVRSRDKLIENKGSGGKYVKKGAIRKLVIHKNGYAQVMLSNASGLKLHLVHRIVAESFIPNTQNLRTVNHINGDKADNRLFNLEWMSQSDNNKHSFTRGLKKPTDVHGSKNPNYKSGRYVHLNGTTVRVCASCGQPFHPRIEKQILCSTKCRGVYNNTLKIKTI